MKSVPPHQFHSRPHVIIVTQENVIFISASMNGEQDMEMKTDVDKENRPRQFYSRSNVKLTTDVDDEDPLA